MVPYRHYNNFLFKVNFSNFCNDKNTRFPYKILALVAILILLALILCFCYNEQIKSLILNNFWCYFQHDNRANEFKREDHDAFVSFVSEDTDFVHNMLVPKLE